jgi:hypothetical protein
MAFQTTAACNRTPFQASRARGYDETLCAKAESAWASISGFGFYAIFYVSIQHLQGRGMGGRLVLHADPSPGLRARRHAHVEDEAFRRRRLERVPYAYARRYDDEDPPVAAARDAVGLHGDDLSPVARREARDEGTRRKDREEEARRQEADGSVVLGFHHRDAAGRRAGAHEQSALHSSRWSR